AHYDLSPEKYPEKWGLPHDYPMVAPAYAAARSHLAKSMGLGRRIETEAVAQPVLAASSKPAEKPAKKRGKQIRTAAKGARNRHVAAACLARTAHFKRFRSWVVSGRIEMVHEIAAVDPMQGAPGQAGKR